MSESPPAPLKQVGIRSGAGTLKRQLITWLAWPLMALWTISSLVDYDIANRFVNLAYDRALLESALDIGRQVKVANDRIYVDLPEIAVQMLQTRESGRVYYLVTGPNSEYITGEPDLPNVPEVESGRVSYFDEEYQGRPVRMVALQLPLDSGRVKGLVTIQVAENRSARTDFARQLLLRMVLPQALLVLITGGMVWYAVGRGLAPLSALRREIQNRSHRDLSALPESQAPQEVQPLIHAMNDLLSRLSKALAAQQRFIADAAHQLRTPIAGLKTQTELALRQTTDGEIRTTLSQLQTATEKTTRLVNQLLSLARAEPGTDRAVSNQSLSLARLMREVTTDWVPAALARKIDLGFEGGDIPAQFEGEAFLLREMMNNLLDNAIRYTQPGGRVTVSVNETADAIVLTVEDNGTGIPENERERVFERFYRVLGTGVDGCGLGLSIVKEIAQRHNANIELASISPGTGTVVRITFHKHPGSAAP